MASPQAGQRAEPMPITTGRVEDLASDGRGIVRLNGKTIFIEGALPGEDVDFQIVHRRREYDEARIRNIHTRSGERVLSKDDLFKDQSQAIWLQKAYDRLLLDPPRAGAREILACLGGKLPPRIVYISCHPATLARDADYLVNERKYKLLSAGVVDMFPHTAHVESMAVFARDGSQK